MERVQLLDVGRAEDIAFDQKQEDVVAPKDVAKLLERAMSLGLAVHEGFGTVVEIQLFGDERGRPGGERNEHGQNQPTLGYEELANPAKEGASKVRAIVAAHGFGLRLKLKSFCWFLPPTVM